MPPSLRVGPDGKVIIQPVAGWAVAASEANGVVFLALEYMDRPEQLETGERGQVQAMLSPQQALEIAEALANAAGKLLGLPHLPRRPLQ